MKARSKSENRHNIITYSRLDVLWFTCLSSLVAERTWHLLHLDVGSLAIANWYRPPGADELHISTLREELVALRQDVPGYIIMGDFI